MEERRKHTRTEINIPAYVSSDGAVMACVVRNISPEGAAIEVDDPAFVPARFRLIMAEDHSVHECIVAWIQQNRIGLTFIAAPKEGGEGRGQRPAALRVFRPVLLERHGVFQPFPVDEERRRGVDL